MMIPNARAVLRKAWSVHLMALAAVLTGTEAVLPFFAPAAPSIGFALLTFVVVCAAFCARFFKQNQIPDVDV